MSAEERDLERITMLLGEAHAGRAEALEEVVSLVYPDLLRRAATAVGHFYGRRDPSPTLEPAALVNETYMKLIRQRARYDSRGHFFSLASQLMLRVLIDHERARGREKRGGRMIRVSLSEASEVHAAEDVPLETFVAILGRLEALDPRAADMVKARLIWGLTLPEIAESFSLSTRTVERELKFAQRWLEVELAREA